jgi:alkylation response protein AidB-like acyl-CoA dehydrogenase
VNVDFDLSAEQKMLQTSLSDLMADAVDANKLVRLNADEMDGLRAKLDSRLFGMGLAGILVPEAQGGLDMGLLTLALVAEELGRNAAPSSVVRNALAAWLIAVAGCEIQKSTWLAKLLDGSSHAAFAIRDAGWMPEEWAASPAKGEARKLNVEGAQDATLFIIGMEDGRLGLLPANSAQIHSNGDPLDATRPIGDVTFASAKIEPLCTSATLANRLRDAHLTLLAADAYGAGQRAFDLSTDYVKTRRQFDRVIGSFQGLKHQLANMALEIHPSRFLVWYAAHAWDVGAEDAAYASALAKAHVPDVAVRIARASVEAHGGIGYTWEYPLHLFLKRTMFDREAWAGVEDHRARAAVLAGW